MIEAGKIDSVVLLAWSGSATDEKFRVAVGNATGRRVNTAISGFEIEQEMATEVCIFEPEPE